MKIDVSKLKENKTEDFPETLSPSEFDAETSDIKYKGDITILTQARKESGVLFTKAHFNAAVECICSRCLREYVWTVEKDFSIEYPLDNAGGLVDITENIRGEIILGYPVKFLCKANCHGLCPHCGQDLNEGDCGCSK